MRNRAAILALMAVGWALPAASPVARGADLPDANEIEELQQDLTGLRERLRFTEEQYGQVIEESLALRVQRRLNDGEILFLQRDYVRASIVFFDVVEEEGAVEFAGYKDALYYLAESLFQNGNYLGARRYFRRLLDMKDRRRFQDSVTRLIQIATTTDDYGQLDRYYAVLTQAFPADRIRAELHYEYAKSLYRRGDHRKALPAFAAIPEDSKYFTRARYFYAVTQVRLGDLERAVDSFRQLQQLSVDNDEEAQIQELTHMALGRLFYELGDYVQSINEYQEIDRNSELFEDTLFEICWSYIKRKDYEKAYEALDLLIDIIPDTSFAPEARLLMGNLLLRLRRFDEAKAVFDQVIEEYAPEEKALEAITSKYQNPRAYYLDVLGPDRGEVDLAAMLPRLAVRWAEEHQEVGGSLTVRRELEGSGGVIQESERIVSKLLAAVDSGDKTSMFPKLREGLTRARELENNLVMLVNQAATMSGSILRPHADAADRAELDRLAEQRAQLQAQLSTSPSLVSTQTMVRQQAESRLNLLDQALTRTSLQIDGMKAQVVAMRKWKMDTAGASGREEDREFLQNLQLEFRVLSELEAELQRLEQDSGAEATRARMGNETRAEITSLRQAYREAIREEVVLHRRLRRQSGGAAQAYAKQFEDLQKLVLDVANELDDFFRQLNDRVEAKSQELRLEILRERDRLNSYRREVDMFQERAESLSGEVAYQTFRDIEDRFHQIVLEADVGIIDYAWQLKREESDKIDSLTEKRNDEVIELNNEFSEVRLEEGEQ